MEEMGGRRYVVLLAVVSGLCCLASMTCIAAAAGRAELGLGVNSWSTISTGSSPGSRQIKTDRPVVGMVTLPVTIEDEKVFGAQSFATSYVRFVQAGGARVAPIFYDSTEEELEAILSKVNGVLWTGSIVEFNPSDDEPEGFKYRRTTEFILEYVIRENQKGNYYPLWGTCLGFERLMELLLPTENDESVLEFTDAIDFATNLELTLYGTRSRLFRNLNSRLLNEVTHPKSNIVYNDHGLGVRPVVFGRDPWVASSLRIVSTNKDRDGKEFISSIEGSFMPIYGSQWHPEKAAWEWNLQLHPSHSADAIEFSNYMGRFFAEECKDNGNSFANTDEESAALIHNWASYPSGNWSVFSEVYFFWSPHPDVRPSAHSAKQLHATDPLLLNLFSSLL